MRVGINATSLNDRPSGARQRFAGVYGELIRQLPDAEFVIFEPWDCRVAEWFAGRMNVSARVTSIPSVGRIQKFTAGLKYWESEFGLGKFDIFDALHLPLVRPKQGSTILTVHDLRGIQPGASFLQRLQFGLVLRDALNRADHVVTVSDAMRSELLAFYPHTPVSVVYNGVYAAPFSDLRQSDCERFRQKYTLPQEFLLSVGHFEKRKNYSRLIASISLLKARGIDCPLVIVGNDSGELYSLKKQVHSLGLDRQVFLLSGLSEEEVRCAYLSCGFFIFPSFYEGFGIPILEAMASKRPMVLSDLQVFREITQNEAVYFNPYEIESIADAIELVLASRDTRDAMVAYGSRRVADFSFDVLASRLAAVYREVLR